MADNIKAIGQTIDCEYTSTPTVVPARIPKGLPLIAVPFEVTDTNISAREEAVRKKVYVPLIGSYTGSLLTVTASEGPRVTCTLTAIGGGGSCDCDWDAALR